MSAIHSAPPQRELRGNFVVLRADTLRLLLPQADVGAASYLDQLPQATDLPGVFRRGGAAGEQAVVALSSQMRPLPQYPKDRFLVTPVVTPQGEFGFGWSEVQVLIDARLKPQALPAALAASNGPLKEFVEIEDQVVFCCDAARLADYALASRD